METESKLKRLLEEVPSSDMYMEVEKCIADLDNRMSRFNYRLQTDTSKTLKNFKIIEAQAEAQERNIKLDWSV